MKKFILLVILPVFFWGCEKDYDNVIDINPNEENSAPVLSNLNAPDTVIVNITRTILITVRASDNNGLEDINRVYFTTTNPDGTSSGAKIDMYDDGKVDEHGDQNTNDGIYSVIIQVTPSNKKGIYKFDFTAQDSKQALSNTISHNIEIK